ncbi:hypothetical protein [Pyruvatibacter sp.]
MKNSTVSGNLVPSTENPDWGFFGTISSHHDADNAWSAAMSAISDATFSEAPAVRLFLDSRHGRHFADSVVDRLAAGASLQSAISAVVDVWMGWSISPKTERDLGIPSGLPYLVGMVGHLEIEDTTT